MTAHLWDYKFSYVSVPKVACSSMKGFLYRVQADAPIKGAIPAETLHGTFPSVHHLRLPRYRIRTHEKVALVRDPESRFLSAFQDKVVGLNCLSMNGTPMRLKLAGLSANPSAAELLRKLPRYRMVCPIVFKHFQTLQYYLGSRPDWFTRVYDLSQIETVAERIRTITGKDIKLPHRNRGSREVAQIPRTDELRGLIEARFKSDFALYGRYFAKPSDGVVLQA